MADRQMTNINARYRATLGRTHPNESMVYIYSPKVKAELVIMVSSGAAFFELISSSKPSYDLLHITVGERRKKFQLTTTRH